MFEEGADRTVWFLQEWKKDIFFTRSRACAVIATILLLPLAQYWLGFLNVIFLMWFFVFYIYSIEIDWIWLEGVPHRGFDESPSVGLDGDIEVMDTHSQDCASRAGLSLGWDAPAVVRYQLNSFSECSELRAYLFFNKYEWVVLSFFNASQLRAAPRRAKRLEYKKVKPSYSSRHLSQSKGLLKASYASNWVIEGMAICHYKVLSVRQRGRLKGCVPRGILMYKSSKWESLSVPEYNTYVRANWLFPTKVNR